MSAFTCITCRVAFMDADLQRGHYKTDWHRYNLKRKVAELPSVTAANFNERVLAQKALAAKDGEDTSSRCDICNKSFHTSNAYENHIQSKKHKEAVAKAELKHEKEIERRNAKNEEKGLDVLSEDHNVAIKNAKNAALQESIRTDGAEVGASSSGLSKKSKSKLAEEDATMEDDDVDAESMESWDGDALGIEQCMFCSHVSKNLEENVRHMTINHSFFIPDIEYLTDLEGLVTYLGMKVGEGHICLWCNEKGKYFNSLDAVQKHMQDKGHCKMLHEGDALFEYSDFYDYRSSYPDHEERAEEGREKPMEEGTEEEPEIDGENFQLVLPSGSSIGHRSLNRYYRQKLKPTRVLTYRPRVNNIITQYKALGWTGTTGVGAARRAKDIAFVQRMKARHFNKLAIKANKFQPYLRPQVVF